LINYWLVSCGGSRVLKDRLGYFPVLKDGVSPSGLA